MDETGETGETPTRPQRRWSKRCSARLASGSSSPIRASITSIPRSARCRAGRSFIIRPRSGLVLELIHRHVAADQRIALSQADAARFAANAVCIGRVIVLSSCSDGLRHALERRGYTVVETALHAFLRSGGSACCLSCCGSIMHRVSRSRVFRARAPARNLKRAARCR